MRLLALGLRFRLLTSLLLVGIHVAGANAQAVVAPPPRYAAVVEQLDRFIAREVAQKELPALSIAVVEDQRIVWARGFGVARAAGRVPATAETVYRVGSVSKLFTDLGVMQLVERGVLDLDAPVTTYLPEFKPANPFGKPVTLRMLMAHRSGLVREPPVGHYFDPTDPTLADTVRSLNTTELVYAPETRIKYSNAAIATVGYVLEVKQREAFAPYLRKAVLEPFGMKRSDFAPNPEVQKDLADAQMWTYDGRTFSAPTFPLGMAPAGSMYATVTDLGRFLSALFAGGGGVVKPATLEQMWTPQFAKEGEKQGFGIGFFVSELEGKKRLGHGGAMYGFATELAALPSEKLGVVVATTKDCANAVTRRIADVTLTHLLAARDGKPLPTIEETTPLTAEVARRWEGRFTKDGRGLDLVERGGRLYGQGLRGGFRVELRARGAGLVMDDCLDHGRALTLDGERLTVGTDTLDRQPVEKPKPLPAKWAGLIGEYGWDHNVLYILEKDGKLQALIEWFFLYPLEEISENVYKFPDWGLYDGEKLVFRRDAAGKATEVVAASVPFQRRPLDGEDGSTFKVKAQRPLGQLRAEALAARPPREAPDLRQPELVDLTTLDPGIKLDIRYATDNNFLSTPFYSSARAYLQKPAAEALARAHRKLQRHGYGLLIHDGYRPWYVTKMFWEATPQQFRGFVANPATGSRHNRGCAVDLTLYDLATGKPAVMPGGYDEFSTRSYPDYPGGTSLQRWQRDLLRRALEEEGFTVYSAEWWHFDYKDWRHYPILNQTFEQLQAGR